MIKKKILNVYLFVSPLMQIFEKKIIFKSCIYIDNLVSTLITSFPINTTNTIVYEIDIYCNQELIRTL